MSDEHPIKGWLKAVATPKGHTAKEQKTRDFLREILSSPFNLITDLKMKTAVVNILVEIPETTLAEKLLKSSLYLLIGNVTRSDNILKDYIQTPPYENWQGFTRYQGIYHQIGSENLEQILTKLSKHPADRLIYQLLTRYIQQFHTDSILLDLIKENSGGSLGNRVKLKYVKRVSLPFVNHLILSEMNENKRIQKLRDTDSIPLKEQAYWDWPFFYIDPLVSEQFVPVLQKIEKDEPLWFIYLMANERLMDMFFSKTNRSFLPGRRGYLRSLLQEERLFMLALYKLIAFGDINQSLVKSTSSFLIDE